MEALLFLAASAIYLLILWVIFTLKYRSEVKKWNLTVPNKVKPWETGRYKSK